MTADERGEAGMSCVVLPWPPLVADILQLAADSFGELI